MNEEPHCFQFDFLVANYLELEIKLCRLGSRIRDMEGESYDGYFICEHLDYFLLLLVSRTSTRGMG